MKRLWRSGEPFVWLTGGALALALIMVGGLVGIILYNALGFFWPADVARLTLRDGTVMTGEVVQREPVYGVPGELLGWQDETSVTVKVPTVFLSQRGGGIFVSLAPADEVRDLPLRAAS